MFRIVLFVLLIMTVTTACGKRGAPIPQDAINMFTWQGSTAELTTQGCLQITADMKGATHNVEMFMLEIEADNEAICRDCPFLPNERVQIEAVTAQQHDEITRYTFQYCPQTSAISYRWRLIAQNVFAALPHALTTPKAVY